MSEAILKQRTEGVGSFVGALLELPPGAIVSGSRSGARGRELQRQFAAARDEGRAEGLAAGRDEGFAAGSAEGFELARDRHEKEFGRERAKLLAQFAAELDALVSEISVALPAWCEAAEAALTARVGTICRAVLLEELKLDRGSVVAIVREAMEEVTHARVARIRVNPQDKHLVAAHKAEFLLASRSVADVEIVDEPGIEGGCVIDTDGGVVEASLGGKLAALEAQLDAEAA